MAHSKNKKDNFNFKSFINLIRQTKPKYWQLWAGLGLGLIATTVQLLVPKVAQSMVNNFSKGVSGVLISGVIALFIISALVNALSGTLLGFFGENVVANLRKLLWNKILRFPVNYFDNVKTGTLTSRLVNDSDQIKNLLSVSFPSSVTSIFQLTGALTIMLFMDWRMTLIMFIAVPLVMTVMRPLMRKTRQVGRQRQDELADFSGKAEETLNEIRLVKSSNAENYEAKSGNQMVNNLFKIGLKEAIYDSIASPLMGTVMMALMVGVLAYGAHRVATGTMTIGTMFAFLMYLFQIIGPVSMMARLFTDLSKANGATDRIQELMSELEENFTAGKTYDVAGKPLQMQNVNFAYEKSQPILKDVSFTANPNSTVAFVGPSGSGKSTIFSLIERYYQPTSGKITIGDMEIDQISLENWRKQIGFVSQDSAIMAGTIRHNLTYGLNDNYTNEQLWQVLKLAYADGFVKEMSDGLDTQVGERGVKVSGGQRQRLAIARAFLRDPKILMLDEATASLDSESEAMVQKALAKLMKGRTTLTIAHRLSTIVDSDDIYFIDHGKVLGHGTHEELLKELPLYQEYVHIQFKQ
ncbi:ABC transporter ATP-binding protein [Fructilactobacillus sanfranciscensis]|uniref:ABC transporter ATP-binding protein n=1 Tax=Fructilactobacillus sanfranciscensis TaxID=1625 RepID=UPI000CD455AE|nr:ABC transporter ATP-binding protein [Fructilactobacillus sanfranciscensis]MVF15330.1 ABC transporter ATP-binding protein [Fructilactobacillus sanfranciscensis]NDR70234.1 ABC transporter ATP-binding protein [Fructilactobacillus sanfranciscensis]NDR77051.1 ABC transporter ATP-binding protein [Fructilactobacillus sanfranciscensis]NDS16851.1 ABC transporter ATP-binding protein [Fructilactobacillus sanfranciscensis]TNK97752.1 ABC transporter ATP-binding protein [Fructilactobacillus sanfranciscen